MLAKAKVYRHPRSPYYQAWFEVWDAAAQKWKPKTQSTKCTEEAKALEIAQGFERVALAAGGMKSRLSREFVVAAINDILTISGHRPIEDQRTWASHSQAWLASEKTRVPDTLSLDSWKVYQSHVKKFDRWLGKDALTLSLGGIDGQMVKDCYAALLKSGLSSNTVNNMFTILSVIFEAAKDEGITQRNPVNLIKRSERTGNTRDDFTPAQMEQILAYLRKSKDPLHQEWLTVGLLGFCTSQRMGDCRRAIRTSFTQTTDWLIWTLQPGKTAHSSGTTLRIPIVEPAASHLASLLRQQHHTSLLLTPQLAALRTAKASLLFIEILSACGIQGRLVKGTGVEGRGFRSLSFHSTRHTCNSLLANAGVPSDLRRQITGHASEAMNTVYTHLKDDTKAAALTKAFPQPKIIKPLTKAFKPRKQA